jgi:hypothetical protein
MAKKIKVLLGIVFCLGLSLAEEGIPIRRELPAIPEGVKIYGMPPGEGEGLVINEALGKAYLPSLSPPGVIVVDLREGKVLKSVKTSFLLSPEVPGSYREKYLRLNFETNKLYFLTQAQGKTILNTFDLERDEIIKTQPLPVELKSGGRWVVNQYQEEIYYVSGAREEVIKVIDFQGSVKDLLRLPQGSTAQIFYINQEKEIYVFSRESIGAETRYSLTIFDAQNDTQKETRTVEDISSLPEHVAVSKQESKIIFFSRSYPGLDILIIPFNEEATWEVKHWETDVDIEKVFINNEKGKLYLFGEGELWRSDTNFSSPQVISPPEFRLFDIEMVQEAQDKIVAFAIFPVAGTEGLAWSFYLLSFENEVVEKRVHIRNILLNLSVYRNKLIGFNSLTHSLPIYSLPSLEFTQDISLGFLPINMELSPSNIYLANLPRNSLSVVNRETGNLREIKLPLGKYLFPPQRLKFNSANGNLYGKYASLEQIARGGMFYLTPRDEWEELAGVTNFEDFKIDELNNKVYIYTSDYSNNRKNIVILAGDENHSRLGEFPIFEENNEDIYIRDWKIAPGVEKLYFLLSSGNVVGYNTSGRKVMELGDGEDVSFENMVLDKKNNRLYLPSCVIHYTNERRELSLRMVVVDCRSDEIIHDLEVKRPISISGSIIFSSLKLEVDSSTQTCYLAWVANDELETVVWSFSDTPPRVIRWTRNRIPPSLSETNWPPRLELCVNKEGQAVVRIGNRLWTIENTSSSAPSLPVYKLPGAGLFQEEKAKTIVSCPDTGFFYALCSDLGIIAEFEFPIGAVTFNSFGQSTPLSYPNPISNQSLFLISGLKGKETRVKIYNLLGQLIQEVNLRKGNTHLSFSNNLPSGVYFYQIEVNGKAEVSQKVLLVK